MTKEKAGSLLNKLPFIQHLNTERFIFLALITLLVLAVVGERGVVKSLDNQLDEVAESLAVAEAMLETSVGQFADHLTIEVTRYDGSGRVSEVQCTASSKDPDGIPEYIIDLKDRDSPGAQDYKCYEVPSTVLGL